MQVGFERQRLTAAHDGDAVIAQRAADQHLVARLALRTAQVHPLAQRADARGVDVHAVAMAAVDHLGIARDQMHARLLGDFGHASANALEVLDGKALFQHEAATQVARGGAAGGNVVHRAAYRQTADIAAREEVRRDHEAVRGKRQALALRRRGQHRRVIAAQKLFACIGGEEHLVDDALHHGAAAAMAEHDRSIHFIAPYICERPYGVRSARPMIA